MLSISFNNVRFDNEWGQSPKDVIISVYGGYGDLILDAREASEKVALDVPDGLYIVRAEIAGRMSEQNVRVKGDTTVEMQLPNLYSPTPIAGAKTTHEYYVGPTTELFDLTSDGFTSYPIGASASEPGELALVIRASNAKVAPTGNLDMADGLVLTNLSGDPLRTIDLNNCVRRHEGFQGFRAQIEPGIYCLVYPKQPRRALVIQTFSERQTQVFATFLRRPLIEEAGIFLPLVSEGFHPFDEENCAADLAIRGLINNQDWLPKAAMHSLLQGKFRNPMLGLLGAFILVRRKEPNTHLLEEVLKNLKRLLPGSVDVQVLQHLFDATAPDSTSPSMPTLHAPPMLRAAMEAAIQISWGDPDYLAPGTLTEQVAPDLYMDSAWTSWRPPEGWGLAGPRFKASSVQPAWIEQTVLEQLDIAKARQDPIEAAAIARRMRLPTATVAAILEHSGGPPDPESQAEMWAC